MTAADVRPRRCTAAYAILIVLPLGVAAGLPWWAHAGLVIGAALLWWSEPISRAATAAILRVATGPTPGAWHWVRTGRWPDGRRGAEEHNA